MSNEANSMTIESLQNALYGVGGEVACDLRNLEQEVTRLTAMDKTLEAIVHTAKLGGLTDRSTRKAVRLAGCCEDSALTTVNELLSRLQTATARLELLKNQLADNA